MIYGVVDALYGSTNLVLTVLTISPDDISLTRYWGPEAGDICTDVLFVYLLLNIMIAERNWYSWRDLAATA